MTREASVGPLSSSVRRAALDGPPSLYPREGKDPAEITEWKWPGP